MQTRILAACLAFATLLGNPAMAGDHISPTGPGEFMAGLGQKVIDLVKDKERPEAERKQTFGRLLDRDFDLPGITRFVLGFQWRSATGAERERFAQVFRRYLIDVEWSRFSGYSGQRFVVTQTLPLGGGLALVKSKIVDPNGNDGHSIKVEWQIMNDNGKYKITDVSVDGASQEVAYRQEFMDVVLRHGNSVQALIDQLRQKDRQLSGTA